MEKVYIKCDTREKDNAYILADFKILGIPYIVEKLDEGDYEASDNDKCCIDIKGGIKEVQNNIAGNKKSKDRFMREVQRCIDKNKKLIVLVREEDIKCVEDVEHWKSPVNHYNNKPITRVSGRFIMKVMQRYTKDYGVEWWFCRKNECARAIAYLLYTNGSELKGKKGEKNTK